MVEKQYPCIKFSKAKLKLNKISFKLNKAHLKTRERGLPTTVFLRDA